MYTDDAGEGKSKCISLRCERGRKASFVSRAKSVGRALRIGRGFPFICRPSECPVGAGDRIVCSLLVQIESSARTRWLRMAGGGAGKSTANLKTRSVRLELLML